MARTAPTVALATPTYVQVSFRMIDASGDLRSDSLTIALADATDAKIEAYVAALAAATNGNVYAVEKTYVWSAVPAASSATAALKESVADNVVVQIKNAANLSNRGFIPAPVAAIFEGDTDVVNATQALAAAYIAALEALFAAGSYTAIGVRFTERREVNEQTKL